MIFIFLTILAKTSSPRAEGGGVSIKNSRRSNAFAQINNFFSNSPTNQRGKTKLFLANANQTTWIARATKKSSTWVPLCHAGPHLCLDPAKAHMCVIVYLQFRRCLSTMATITHRGRWCGSHGHCERLGHEQRVEWFSGLNGAGTWDSCGLECLNWEFCMQLTF